MNTPVERVVGSLKTITIEGRSGGPCVVLFHGYGADSSDLVPLYDLMNLGPHLTWMFPNGPLEVIVAPGFYGRCWFPIDMNRLEQGMVTGKPADLSQVEPNGLPPARKSALEFYEVVRSNHSQVFLGGFSQGSMLALEVAFQAKIKPDGLLLFSSSLLAENRWRELAKSCSDVPFFQSHGKQDALLGFEYAERLYDMMSEAGMHGEFMSFGGGHEIPTQVIQKAARFIRSNLRPLH